MENPYFYKNLIAPLKSYYPSDELLEKMLFDQENGVQESVRTVKQLRQKYCN